jgi:hypothetical protein
MGSPITLIGGVTVDPAAIRHWAFWLGDPGDLNDPQVRGALYHVVKDALGNARFEARALTPDELRAPRQGTMFKLVATLTDKNFERMCKETFRNMGAYNAWNNNCQDFCLNVLHTMVGYKWFEEDPEIQMKKQGFKNLSDYFLAQLVGAAAA